MPPLESLHGVETGTTGFGGTFKRGPAQARQEVPVIDTRINHVTHEDQETSPACQVVGQRFDFKRREPRHIGGNKDVDPRQPLAADCTRFDFKRLKTASTLRAERRSYVLGVSDYTDDPPPGWEREVARIIDFESASTGRRQRGTALSAGWDD